MQNVFPILRYERAENAIEWLSKSFGFELIFRVPEGGEYVRHAQMNAYGNIIMLGSVREDDGLKSPQQLGNATQSLCVYLDEVEKHFRHSIDAGVEIALPLTHTDIGSTEYHAKDLEGHLWTFSNFCPTIPKST